MACAAVYVAAFVAGLFVLFCHGQSPQVAENIYESLPRLNCTKFWEILNKAPEDTRRMYMGARSLTVFAFSDAAFEKLNRTGNWKEKFDMDDWQSKSYVMSLTMSGPLRTADFHVKQQTRNILYESTIFFTRRSQRKGNSSSGAVGRTVYYANSAAVVRPDIPAGPWSVIHVIDRVLEAPCYLHILDYIRFIWPEPLFFRNYFVFKTRYHYEFYNESETGSINANLRTTAFIPTNKAINLIPWGQLTHLQKDRRLLNNVVRLHIVTAEVLYTSFVYHNETVQSLGMRSLTFRRTKSDVYVSGGGVTARITHGDVPVKNGVVHYIDAVLGFKYQSAIEEVRRNSLAEAFNIHLATEQDIQHAIMAPSGVITLFIPTTHAFSMIYDYGWQKSRKILQLCMLVEGQTFELSDVRGDYSSRLTRTTRYKGHTISIYNQGNDIYVETACAKARLVLPDVGVTNGFVYYIDGVLNVECLEKKEFASGPKGPKFESSLGHNLFRPYFGAPSLKSPLWWTKDVKHLTFNIPCRDIPTTISCEADWLGKSFDKLELAGLNWYLRSLERSAPCEPLGELPQIKPGNVPSSLKLDCGYVNRSCSFTVFLPSNSAVDSFANQNRNSRTAFSGNVWSRVLQRHITREQIYIEEKAIGVEFTFTALSGDKLVYRRIDSTHAYLRYGSIKAQILRTDLAAINGVVHVVDLVLSTARDLAPDFH